MSDPAVGGPAVGDPAAGPLPRRVVGVYAAGSFANGIFGTVPGLVLLYFLTDTLGVPAWLAGIAVFLPKIADVLWNPLVGAWSDRTTSPRGPRLPWLLAGGIALPPLFVLMFAVPDAGPWVSAGWVCVTFLLAGFAYGCFQVPYTALPTELTADRDERSRIQLARVVVLALGILAGGAAAPVLVTAGGEGRSGYLLMSVVLAVLLAVSMLVCAVALPVTGRASAAAEGQGGSLPAALRVAVRVPSYWALFTGYVVQSLAIAVALAAIPYYSTYVLGREGYSSVLFAAFVGPSLLVVPLWRRLEQRYGKRWCLLASSFLLAASALVVAPGWLAPVLPLVGFTGCGIAYAGQQLYAYSLLSDALAEADAEHGGRRAGLLGGLWTATETGMFAIGPGIVGGLLAVTGFVSSEAGETVAQPGSAIVGIAVATGLLPAALIAAGLPRYLRVREDARAPAEREDVA